MKRPLEYIAGGFVLGEVLALLPVVWSIGISVLLLAGVFWLWIRKGRSFLWWLLPVFCVFGMMRLWGDRERVLEYEEIQEFLKDRQVTAAGRVKGIKEDGEKERVTLELTKVTLEYDQQYVEYGTVLAYADRSAVYRVSGGQEEMEVRIGMEVSLKGTLEGFGRPGNPGEFDYGGYYHSLGIEGRFWGEEIEIEDENYSPFFHGIYRARCYGVSVFEAVCSEKDRGIFCAMVLGDKSELSDEIRNLYQKNGIAHLLAISGLHISMIGMGAYGLCRKTGMGFGGAGAVGAAVTISYGVLAGGNGISASVVRAVLMVLLQMLAGFLGRTYDMRTAAGMAGLLLLIQSPALLFQAGFQLSFMAVLSLGIGVPAAEKWLGVKSKWMKTLLAGAVIQLATCPVVMYHYFEYPVYGMFLNLAVLPLMTYMLISGILAAGAGGFSVNGGKALAGTGHYVLEFYQWLCERAEVLPGAVRITGRPEIWKIGIYGLLWCGALAVMTEEAGRRKREGKSQETKQIKGAMKKWIFILGISILSLWILTSPRPVKGMEVTFLDVGQGDGICIRTKDMVILVDGGSTDRKNVGSQVLKPFLKSRGISQVDYAIVSHGDQDHVSGLKELLEDGEGIRVCHVILPWLGRDLRDQAYESLENLAADHGADRLWMKRGDYLKAGELEVVCLYGGKEGTGDRNDHSLLVQVKYGLAGILLTGDMNGHGEQQWLNYDDKIQIQVLKVAHHGSAYSTKEEFLLKTDPDFAVISCGEGNRYGHPSPETIKRLENCGIFWYATTDSGAVMLETDGEKLEIRTFR